MNESKTNLHNVEVARTASIASTPASSDPGPATDRPIQSLAGGNRVETMSTEFVMGRASVSPANKFSHVFAVLDNEVIGCSIANITRPDLDRAREEGRFNAYAFVLVFDRAVPAASVQSIGVFVVGQQSMLPHATTVKLDLAPPLRLFVMGSPRSGTSELGSTLSKVFQLAWLGEGHAAPLFSNAADALTGNADDANGLVRFLAQQNFRRTAIEAANRAYFYMHNSASFVDKTPGVAMIKAAPFLNECFPNSRFIFLRRNPVANVLSRMIKFGGNFEAHCKDWAAAMNEWLKIRALLPHYLELQQEEMLETAERTAQILADYIGVPDKVDVISQSLRAGSLERTGAGIGKSKCSQTLWTPDQVRIFEKYCGPTMREFGYG
jgi:Sulfotransferase family